ncbi:MAG: hypothetical protein KF703_00960 [Actinobacteria bacterium]|nr:hypothetical protein [Actinomycetota bacterium]
MTDLVAGHGTDRRHADLLAFDPVARRLSIGSAHRVVPGSGGNAAVLAAFVELVGSSRGVPPADLVEVRETDLDALCEALDLGAADLRDQLQARLGLSRVVSRQLITRLRQRRVLRGVAATAAGIAVLGGVAAGAAAASPTPDREPRAAVARDAAPDPEAPTVDGPLTETPEGVGLIPPLEVEADGTMLVPPVQIDRGAGEGAGD